MYCKDCAYFKFWRYFGAAMCEITSQPIELPGKICEKFIPKGNLTEWGEENRGSRSCC